ncbi:MAG: hypothetical protein ABJA50_06340 [Chloroflexota bacterium]
MSENLVRSVLKEYIEGDMPGKKDPWPAISAMLPQALDGSAAPLINEQATRAMAAQSQAHTLPGGRRFRVNMAMALIALLVLTGLSAIFVATRQQSAPLASLPLTREFLPAGMVRHMVYTGNTITDRSALGGTVETIEQHHEEFWLAQGQSHPLMKDIVTVPISFTNWLDDSGYYSYDPAGGNTVSRSDYDPQVLVTLLPDPEIITKSLQIPGAHLVGNDTLDGRLAVVISYGDPNTLRAAPTSTATKGVTSYMNTVVTYWIDSETNQLLQYSSESAIVRGAQIGLIEKTVHKIALNELLPRSMFPANFFNFKLPEGAVLSNGETPTPERTAAPGKP